MTRHVPDLFRSRVAAVRQTWEETDQLATLGGRTDREALLGFLCLFHRWARESAEAIRDVYGEELAIDVGPEPQADAARPTVSVSLGGEELIVAWLAEVEAGDDRWSMRVVTRSREKRGTWIPERPNGAHRIWTRAQVENLMLGAVVGFERERRVNRRAPLRPVPVLGDEFASRRRGA